MERRRRWSAAEKERLVAASLEPGAVVSALAREAGVHPSQLYGWRRQLCARDAWPPATEMPQSGKVGKRPVRRSTRRSASPERSKLGSRAHGTLSLNG
jgi:transposase